MRELFPLLIRRILFFSIDTLSPFIFWRAKCPKTYSFDTKSACQTNFGRNTVAQLSTVAHSLLYHVNLDIVNQVFQIFTKFFQENRINKGCLEFPAPPSVFVILLFCYSVTPPSISSISDLVWAVFKRSILDISEQMLASLPSISKCSSSFPAIPITRFATPSRNATPSGT
jgi:hypothetical protein